MEGVDEGQLGHDDGEPLEVDGLPAIIFQVAYAKHGRVDKLGGLGEKPLEVGEKGRVVEGPFRRLLVVPLPGREAVGDGQPVAVDFEVGRLTTRRRSARARRGWVQTY